MDNFNGIVYFVKTAEALSFVGAARALGVSASAVGKSIAKLEQTMGVRLFQRSTRKVNLTAEGEMFYQRCRSILDDLDEAQAMLSHAIQTPRGKLRLSLPTATYCVQRLHIWHIGASHAHLLNWNSMTAYVIAFQILGSSWHGRCQPIPSGHNYG